MENWRLLDTGPRSAADNMALDEVLLEGRSDRTIRITMKVMHACGEIGVAQSLFEQQKFEVAELFYVELLALLNDSDPFKKDVEERVAACIYKQAEHFRGKGVMRSAIEQFERLITTVPNSSVRPIAEYDIAGTFLIENGHAKVAKEFILYRRGRQKKG